MATADYEDSSVVIVWRVSEERNYETDFADMAKILGISKAGLARILDGDDSLDEVSDKAKAKLGKLGSIDSEEWELDEISEG